jgi:DNA-binding NarL/FixJ family response regulator
VRSSGQTGARAAHLRKGTSSRQPSGVAFDEYPLWLETIARVAESVGVQIVGASTHIDETVEMLRAERPGLFILGLDRANGQREQADSLLEIVSEIGGVSTIVTSNDDDPEFIEHCLSSGATAYVLKTIRPDDLSSTIRQAVDRCVYLFGLPKRRPESDLDKLTQRELEVLLHVADGLSNAEVARRLWISVATVKFHLTKTYEKLGVTNRTGAVRWAQRHGLLTPDARPAPRPERRPATVQVRRAAGRGQSLSRS